jgi:hypothetical protein
MASTKSEDIVAQINASVFFKEFTFSKNDFKALDGKQQLELADNVVWLGDMLFIYQIKEREPSAGDDAKWFESKVLNKGVKQIKSTLRYLNTYPEINITNEKGHKLNVAEAKTAANVKKIVIYTPNQDFPEALRKRKFYESAEVGLIHLFHSEDYYWVCKYLITPTEVDSYLNFREQLYLHDKEASNALLEQYFLSHFFETPRADHFNPSYSDNLKNYNPSVDDFDISSLMENFAKNIKLTNTQTEYYPIIVELAMLHRSELIEFKKRFYLALEKSGSKDLTFPYRMYLPRTDCAYVFIPLTAAGSQHWQTALFNLTMIQKYLSKARKCVGVVVFRGEQSAEHYEIFWQYSNEPWAYNQELETLLKDNPPPFRETSDKSFGNPYL